MNIIHRPKIIIPIALIAAFIIAIFAAPFLGRKPVVNLSTIEEATSTVEIANTVDLSFPKSGRIAQVTVSVGSPVKKGDVLASLEATDALGALNQAKGALELAKAQSGTLTIQYETTRQEQDTLVENARRALLSGGLTAVAESLSSQATMPTDNSQAPTITGTYTCEKEGQYVVEPYQSGVSSGYSFQYSGLESGGGSVTFYTPQPLGSCGLYIQFPVGYSSLVKWVIDIPNTKSASYAVNKNAYDLALSTRTRVLAQLEANLGKSGTDANTSQATIDAALGAYQAALGAYQNTIITAPFDGTVTSVDSHLKVGQSIAANKTVITVTK